MLSLFRLREGLIRSFNVVQCRAAFVGDFLSFVSLFSGPVAEMKLKKALKQHVSILLFFYGIKI